MDSTLLATSPSLKAFITGIPPPTLASKPMSRPSSMARENISRPWVERRALLAVTTCFPFSRAFMTNSLATPVPPTSSITICISGSLRTSSASLTRTPLSSFIPLSLSMSLSAILFKTSLQPSLSPITSAFSLKTLTTPVPPVPRLMRPTFISIRFLTGLYPFSTRPSDGLEGHSHTLGGLPYPVLVLHEGHPDEVVSEVPEPYARGDGHLRPLEEKLGELEGFKLPQLLRYPGPHEHGGPRFFYLPAGLSETLYEDVST